MLKPLQPHSVDIHVGQRVAARRKLLKMNQTGLSGRADYGCPSFLKLSDSTARAPSRWDHVGLLDLTPCARSLGQSRALRLVYISTGADPQPNLTSNVTIVVLSSVPFSQQRFKESETSS